VFLVNLLAALNFGNVFFKNKKRLKNKKLKNVKKRDQKAKKTFFTSMISPRQVYLFRLLQLLHDKRPPLFTTR